MAKGKKTVVSRLADKLAGRRTYVCWACMDSQCGSWKINACVCCRANHRL